MDGMHLMHSMDPNDEELLRFALDGEPLSAEAQAHIEQCESCQQRLATFQQVNDSLTSKLYRSQCPSGTQLSFYCADLLPPDDRMHIAAHILDCPLCADEVAETRLFMTEVEPMPVVTFSPRAALRRVVASLVRQQAQLVMRSGPLSETRWPRQYRAESIDLSLHLSRASNGEYLLLGILTSVNDADSVDAFEGSPADLYSISDESDKVQTPIRTAAVDDLGNLVFNAVPTGQFTLIIHLPECEVVIEDITIEQG